MSTLAETRSVSPGLTNYTPIEDAFRYHVDGDPENVWSAKETIDSGLGNEVGIGGVADNHGSMKAAPDGRIFLVAKDSDDVGYLHLYIRSAAGVWVSPFWLTSIHTP